MQSNRRVQRGISFLGIVFVLIVLGIGTLIALRVLPTVNEYTSIRRAVDRIATGSASTVPEIRAAFDKQKDIEYSITSISGKDLIITKQNDRVVISFAYDKEIELMEPVWLLIKYRGSSK